MVGKQSGLSPPQLGARLGPGKKGDMPMNWQSLRDRSEPKRHVKPFIYGARSASSLRLHGQGTYNII